MPLKFFTIPVHDDGEIECQVNQFLGAHRILAVDRQWVPAGLNSFWAVCIDYLAKSSEGAKRGTTNPSKARVDYKEILTADQFAAFSKLRDLRKQLAQVEAVPVYAIFTNDQLAQMIQMRAKNKAELLAIDGIGESRIEKYGAQLLELLAGLDKSSIPS